MKINHLNAAKKVPLDEDDAERVVWLVDEHDNGLKGRWKVEVELEVPAAVREEDGEGQHCGEKDLLWFGSWIAAMKRSLMRRLRIFQKQSRYIRRKLMS